MAEGFKLLDAYVEVTASGKGLAEKVGRDFESESPAAASRAGGSFGTGLLGGFKGALGAGIVGGIVSSFGYSVMNQMQNVVGSAFQFAKGAVVDFNSQLENSSIGFTTMLGSAQKAQVFLGQLQQFAKTTPFEFGNLVQNAQQMMGMGIAAKDVIPDLRALGDSVASVGGSASQVDQVTLAFDQMAAKGTLDMGNMNQLLQGGVPSALKILAASYKVTTGQMITMISTGKVQSSVALPALVKGLESGTSATKALGGMMDKQSATMTGALSNISDGLNQAIAKGFRPFFKILEDSSIKLANFVSTPAFAHFVGNIGNAMTGGLHKIQSFVTDVGHLFSPEKSPAIKVGGWLKQISALPKPHNPFAGLVDAITRSSKTIPDDLRKAFASLESSAKKALPNLIEFAKTTAPTLINLFDKLIKLSPKVGTALGNLSPVLKPLGLVFNNLVDKAIIPTINKLSDFLDLLNGKKGAANTLVMDGLSGKLGTDFQFIGQGVAATTLGVKAFIDHMVGSFIYGGGQIRDFASGFIGTMHDLAAGLVDFTSIMDTIGRNIVGGLVAGIEAGAGAVVGAVQSLISLVPMWARKLLGIASPSKVFHLIGRQVGEGLHLGLLGSVDQIKATAGKLVDAVRGGFSGRLETGMVREISTVAHALERLSVKRADAMSALSTARTDRSALASTVRSNLMGGADVTALYSATATAAPMTTLGGVAYQPSWTAQAGLNGVKANLRHLLADTRRFTGNLGRLAKMGIDPATYDQLVQAGVAGGGLATSDALLSDPTGFRQIVALERQISSAAGRLGSTAAGHEYAARIGGLERQVHNYNITMTVDAKKIDDLAKLVRMVEGVKRTARAH